MQNKVIVTYIPNLSGGAPCTQCRITGLKIIDVHMHTYD